MRQFCYGLHIIIGSLAFAFLPSSSFGSDCFKQEETQEKILIPAPGPQTAVLLSPEYRLPHDISVHILSFLTEQKDLLRIGVVSKSWRKVTEKVWENRMLDLSNKSLTADHYTTLTKGIFPRLRLNNGKLTEEGMNILATCSHLQALELTDNNLQTTEVLITLLSLPRLFHINLTRNKIGAEGAKALAKGLKTNTALTSIDLSFNQIGTEGLRALAEGLKDHTSLTGVYLSLNQIGDAGAKALAEGLKANTVLRTVWLDNNQISDAGAKALAEGLKTNTALTTVILSSNQIGNEGLSALAEGLKANTVLTRVDLSYNQIGDAGLRALAEGLKVNTALKEIYLWANQIGDEGKRALENLKRSRPSLKLEY